jgi:hypothetical protein
VGAVAATKGEAVNAQAHPIAASRETEKDFMKREIQRKLAFVGKQPRVN